MTAFFLMTALACSAVAEDWLPDPFHWKQKDGTVTAVGMGGAFLESADSGLFERVSVAARLTPGVSETNGWSTLGVAVRSDEDNFWCLALVRSPAGGRHLELAEMRSGQWLSQDLDKLPRTDAAQVASTWREGETYALELSMDGAIVRGTIRTPTGQIAFDRTYRTKGKPCVRGGSPALRRTGSFKGTFADIRTTRAVPLPRPSASVVTPYACENFAHGITGRATGFFHTEQLDGRWWVIDPLGRGYVACGCDHIQYGAGWSQRTGRSRHREANDRLFASRADWEKTTVRRLLDWGFNQLGAGADVNLRHRGLSHTIFLSMGDSLCYGEDDTYYILRNEHRPCSAFPNVFHPDFPAWCDSVARRKCAPHRDNPWLYGYYLDNEFRWWGHGDTATGLFDDIAKLRCDHTARQALEAYLASSVPGGRAAFDKLDTARSREIKLGFLRICAERYFSACRDAIRRYDPNHMILGARFAGLGGAHPEVWKVAGRYSDIVTFNCYPWCDLNREALYTHRGTGGRLLQDAFAERFAEVGKPLQVTEWSFPALDVKLPCLHGAGQRMPTQRERVRATELCARTFLGLPFIVGYDYFMWADEPAEGISDDFPEDSNYGLLDVNAKPYPELTAMFTRIQKDVARWRSQPPPQPKTDVSFGQKAAEAWQAARVASEADFVRRPDGAYVLSSAAGLRLAGRVGGRGFFESFQLNGSEYGPISAMLSVRMKSGHRSWPEATCTTAVDWDERTKTVSVTAKGVYENRAFAVKADFRLSGTRVFCEIRELQNIGAQSVDAYDAYICVRSPFAAETEKVQPPQPPNRWSDEARTGWKATDGRFVCVVSRSPAVADSFRYWTSPDGGVHPDAAFTIPGRQSDQPATLIPSGKLSFDGACWAWLEPGRKD